MKKLLFLLTCMISIMFTFASYAASQESVKVDAKKVDALPTSISGDKALDVLLNDYSKTNPAALNLATINGLEDVRTKQEPIYNQIVAQISITNENAQELSSSIEKFIKLRNIYLKYVLLKLDEIKSTKDKELSGKAINKFEEILKEENEKDKVVQQKIKLLIEYLESEPGRQFYMSNYNFRFSLRKMIEEYYSKRKAFIYIFDEVKKQKINLHNELVNKIQDYAVLLKKKNKLDLALRFYEEALKYSDSTNNLFDKIGELNQLAKKKNPVIYVDNRKISTLTDPIIKNKRTLVPMRAISEALNSKVEWHSETRTVTVEKAGKLVVLPIGSNVLKVNNHEITADQPAIIVNGTTLVPIRVISETLDAKVGWITKGQIVTVDDNFWTEEGTIPTGDVVKAYIMTQGQVDKKIESKTTKEVIENLLSANDNIDFEEESVIKDDPHVDNSN